MNKTVILAAAAAVLAAVPAALPAYAATANLSPGDAQALCAKLEKQYDFIRPFKPRAELARTAGTYKDAEKNCAAGKPAIGVKELRQAILDLNVEPHTL